MANETKGAGIGASKGGVMPPAQSSAPTHIPAGTGSRPGPGKYPIPTSAPSDPHGLDGRKTPGALS
jgi:hypothetical protein